jgi:hypothetical protein
VKVEKLLKNQKRRWNNDQGQDEPTESGRGGGIVAVSRRKRFLSLFLFLPSLKRSENGVVT